MEQAFAVRSLHQFTCGGRQHCPRWGANFAESTQAVGQYIGYVPLAVEVLRMP